LCDLIKNIIKEYFWEQLIKNGIVVKALLVSLILSYQTSYALIIRWFWLKLQHLKF